MPSHTMRGCAARRLAIVRATVADERWRGRPASETIAAPRSARRRSPGRRSSSPAGGSTPMMPVRSTLRCRNLRPPPARQPADGALGDPAFLNQLIDNGRDRAALQPRTAGQIGPRHRLVVPKEVERNPPVDLTGRLARRDLEVRQIDLAHAIGGNCIRRRVCRIESVSAVVGPVRI